MKILLALPVAALLAGCMPNHGPPAPPYHAVGTEPFWSLLIDARDLTFTQPDAQPIRQRRPQVIVGVAGEIYQTPRINVNIVHGRCSDGLRRTRQLAVMVTKLPFVPSVVEGPWRGATCLDFARHERFWKA